MLSHSKPAGTSFLSGSTQREAGGGGGGGDVGGSQEHRNGNACNTPTVIDYKTLLCWRGEKALPGATKTSCQKFTRVCMCVCPRQRKQFVQISVVGGKLALVMDDMVDNSPCLYLRSHTHILLCCYCRRACLCVRE